MVYGRWGLTLIIVVLFCISAATLKTQESPPDADPATIEGILQGMTLERKVGQMFMVNLFGTGLSEAGRDMLQTWQPGAVVILDSNIITPDQITRLTNSYQQTITEAGGVPLFITTDQEGGLIARLKEGFTTWPVPMLLTAADDPELAFRVGQGLASELRAVGLNMNLAPVADLRTNLRDPIIGRRSPGSHPALVGRMLAGFIAGMQAEGVLATAKHFPGHGESDQDSHTTLPELALSRLRLSAVELPPFVSAINADVGAVMMAHIWYSELDSERIPASLSYNVVTGLLREALGYEGIIMTDAMDMDAIDTNYSPEAASVMAVQAGIDLLLIGAHAGENLQARAMQAVVDAVRAGEISQERIDDSVRRILTAKARMGVLDWQPLDPFTAASRINRAAHDTLIEEVFAAGVTVAYDNNNVLPFSPQASVGILYPGNRASVWTECRQYSPAIQWLSISDTPPQSEIETAVRFAEAVDTVVVFTRDALFNRGQQQLVNALPPEKTFVVALVSPFDQVRFPQISGYMVTYSALQPAVEVACGILFGAYEARGTLAIDLSLRLD